MREPKVSVIIPVYNEEKYLEECLNSVINQTLSDIEIICVDAGSSDMSVDILNKYAEKDERLTILTGNGRIDAGAARNLGLAAASGAYLSFLDADDFFHPAMLERSWKKMVDEKSDILVFQAQEFNMSTGAIRAMPWSLKRNQCPRRSPFSPQQMRKYLFNSFQNWTWNKLFRKEFIINNNISFQSIARTNDMAFTCQALAVAERISILPETFTTYRVGTGTSLQQTNDLSPTCFWEAYKETKRRLQIAGCYESFEQSFLNAVLSGSLYNLDSVRSDYGYREILYLLKYDVEHFNLLNRGKKYFYNHDHYNRYCRIMLGMPKTPTAVEKPLVSVVLPCLNSREYIRECVESILEQTLQEIEIIIVDAGSNDGTLDILQQYAQKDSRIRIINSDRKSYGYQMNLGLKAANGKYFTLVESDDYIRPNMYSDLYQMAERHNLEVLKADYCYFVGTHKKRKYTYRKIISHRDLYNTVLDPREEPRVFSNYVVSWCGIYKTEFLKSKQIYHHESPGASFQDNGFWFQVFTQARRVMFHSQAYYMLRRDNPGSSVYNPQKAYCMASEYDYIRQFLSHKPELERIFSDLCAYKRFKNILWANDNLVTDENRNEYILRMSADFCKIYDNGEINPDLFTIEEYDALMTLINYPHDFCQYYGVADSADTYYIGPVTCDAYIYQLIEEKKKLEREISRRDRIISQKSDERQELERSISYKIGRFITFLPRKIRGGIWCCQENGIGYTLKYAVKKVYRILIGGRSGK